MATNVKSVAHSARTASVVNLFASVFTANVVPLTVRALAILAGEAEAVLFLASRVIMETTVPNFAVVRTVLLVTMSTGRARARMDGLVSRVKKDVQMDSLAPAVTRYALVHCCRYTMHHILCSLINIFHVFPNQQHNHVSLSWNMFYT